MYNFLNSERCRTIIFIIQQHTWIFSFHFKYFLTMIFSKLDNFEYLKIVYNALKVKKKNDETDRRQGLRNLIITSRDYSDGTLRSSQ